MVLSRSILSRTMTYSVVYFFSILFSAISFPSVINLYFSVQLNPLPCLVFSFIDVLLYSSWFQAMIFRYISYGLVESSYVPCYLLSSLFVPFLLFHDLLWYQLRLIDMTCVLSHVVLLRCLIYLVISCLIFSFRAIECHIIPWSDKYIHFVRWNSLPCCTVSSIFST